MTNKDAPTHIERKPGKSKTTIYTIVIGIIIVVMAIKIYLDYKTSIETQEFYQAELATAQQKFDEINIELEQKIITIDSLGGDITDLITTRDQLQIERNQLKRTREANGELISRLRRKTDGYEELLKQKDKEIENLAKLNKALLTENTGLKIEKNELNRSIGSLQKDKEVLESKVAIAARLNIENLTISSISKSGKKRTGVLKRKKINKLRVEFNIRKNNVAPLEAKEILIRISDENGQVLFDVTRGSGSFILDGKETFYTESQDILFDNTGQKLEFIYDKGTRYDPGAYKLEVFTDGYRMGATNFTVK